MKIKKLFFIILLFFFTHIILCYGTNILFQDDFESGTVGAFPDGASGDGAIWIGPIEEIGGLSYNMELINTLSHNGANSFFIQTDDAGFWIRAVASFNQSSDNYVNIDYYVRIGNLIPSNNRCAVIKYIDASSKIAAQITFNDIRYHVL